MSFLKSPVLAALIFSKFAWADLPAEVAFPRSEVQHVTSHVNGAGYKLSVFMPVGYEKGDRRYPTLYVVTGTVGNDVAAATRRLAATKDIPETLVVAIDFDAPDGYWQDLPTIDKGGRWEIDERHGAANFLDTLLKDIKPAIDKRYRTDTMDTGLVGHSLGGFFALYALFHAPGAFQHLWSSSPSMIWDHAVLLQHADGLVASPDVKARVFTSIGDEEDANMREPLARLNVRMQALNFKSLRWQSYIAVQQNHYTVEPATVYKAMLELYGLPRRQPDLAELQSLVGTYRLADARTFWLKLVDGRLCYVSDDGAYDGTEMQTYAADEWIIRGTQLRFSVRWQPDGEPQILLRAAPSPGPGGDTVSPATLAVRTSR